MKTTKRQIIKIDDAKCTGCGECLPNCPEGALQIIDGKARLISDLFCDGLGACIGHCPEGAISTEERQAEAYDERKVMANIVKHGSNTVQAHLKHLKDHKQNEYLKQAIDFLKEKGINVSLEEAGKCPEKQSPCAAMPCGDAVRSVSDHRSGCPGSALQSFAPKAQTAQRSEPVGRAESQLTQWPVQLMLVPPGAPFLKDSHLLLAADCVAYAYASLHQDFLTGKSLLIACPKLDDTEIYVEKLTEIFKHDNIKSVTILHMEVPCCLGLIHIAKNALHKAGCRIPIKAVTISRQGDIKREIPVCD